MTSTSQITYKALEGDSLNAVGVKMPTFDGQASLLATSTFVYTLFFIAIVMAAFYRYVYAGTLRIQASESGIRQSNEIIRKVTLGLIGVFMLFILLFTVNRNLVTGDVGFGGLSGSSGGSNGSKISTTQTASSQGTSNTQGKTCESPGTVISRMSSQNGVCGNTSCTKLSGCNYKQYESVIATYTGNDTRLKKMAIVVLCIESGGNQRASNNNPDGTYDCGLMQINQKAPCTDSSFNIEYNIQKGVDKLRYALSKSSQVYPGVPVEATVFSSYNCCSNGTIPGSPSNDCTPQAGFPSTLPKWACPINPGEGKYNMCSVKSYACEASACFNQL